MNGETTEIRLAKAEEANKMGLSRGTASIVPMQRDIRPAGTHYALPGADKEI